jgi:hypothetical protein
VGAAAPVVGVGAEPGAGGLAPQPASISIVNAAQITPEGRRVQLISIDIEKSFLAIYKAISITLGGWPPVPLALCYTV